MTEYPPAGASLHTSALRAAFPHTLPVLTGFTVLGMAYGVLMQTKGYGVGWSVLMSAVAFCGSMQYAAIALLTTVFDPVQAFLMSLMVNARHLFYGLSLLDKYRSVGKLRSYLIFALCDETFSIVSGTEPPDGVEAGRFYFCISALDHFYWVFGTFLGGLLGELVTFNTAGMDFALTALFVVLLTEQMSTRSSFFSGLIGLICSAAALLLFGAGGMVIPAMVFITAALLIGRDKL